MYDLVQALFGARHTQARLAPWLASAERKRILDVGAGTGLQRSLVPETAWYIWLDVDWTKLHGYRRRHSDGAVVIGDGSIMPLRDRSVDFGLCVAVSHQYLTDGQLTSLFAELALVVRERVIFLDALYCREAWRSRLLWRCDGGGHPRSADTLLAAMAPRLEVDHIEEYRVYHRYLLGVARPRAS
ncbi:MAG TPA: class I SAM-dependent methyltransferase [Candidatus Methylomirabilis sp.]|nr:class I SAM-dependent methyltransferase [Candidatus Methylomirabilis sp.]